MLIEFVELLVRNDSLNYLITCMSLVLNSYNNLSKYDEFKVSFPSDKAHSFFERTVGFMFSGLGGGILLGLLFGRGPLWLYSEAFFYTACLVWVTMNIFWKFPILKQIISSILEFKPTLALFIFAGTIVDGLCLTEGGVDFAFSSSKPALKTAPVIILSGFVSVVGGALLGEMFNIHGHWRFQRSSSLRLNAAPLVITLVLSIIYTIAVFSLPSPISSVTSSQPVHGMNQSLFKLADIFGLSSYVTTFIDVPVEAVLYKAVSSQPVFDRIQEQILNISRAFFEGYTNEGLQVLFITIFSVPMFFEYLGMSGFFKVISPKVAVKEQPSKPEMQENEKTVADSKASDDVQSE